MDPPTGESTVESADSMCNPRRSDQLNELLQVIAKRKRHMRRKRAKSEQYAGTGTHQSSDGETTGASVANDELITELDRACALLKLREKEALRAAQMGQVLVERMRSTESKYALEIEGRNRELEQLQQELSVVRGENRHLGVKLRNQGHEQHAVRNQMVQMEDAIQAKLAANRDIAKRDAGELQEQLQALMNEVHDYRAEIELLRAREADQQEMLAEMRLRMQDRMAMQSTASYFGTLEQPGSDSVTGASDFRHTSADGESTGKDRGVASNDGAGASCSSSEDEGEDVLGSALLDAQLNDQLQLQLERVMSDLRRAEEECAMLERTNAELRARARAGNDASSKEVPFQIDEGSTVGADEDLLAGFAAQSESRFTVHDLRPASPDPVLRDEDEEESWCRNELLEASLSALSSKTGSLNSPSCRRNGPVRRCGSADSPPRSSLVTCEVGLQTDLTAKKDGCDVACLVM
eukprot:NODE_1798_length_1602_cov_51.128465_g1712_i0.p1 GENE.NODE_1798_length_1602_cov_51.128465_g1712_i0~~NODE_1798_length_1602_cov_51.128465_g1712_i0.p1  ORF type:complete len:466 (-),score=74.01 NODE_1798_length_1602_cov_51.128465_g1712_i0:140-1537(-)